MYEDYIYPVMKFMMLQATSGAQALHEQPQSSELQKIPASETINPIKTRQRPSIQAYN